ncbi:MAG: hypothetical protein ACTS73_09660 [Arsenophonus sp. NEOnobi-MAG3]
MLNAALSTSVYAVVRNGYCHNELYRLVLRLKSLRLGVDRIDNGIYFSSLLLQPYLKRVKVVKSCYPLV